jgi:hypothetical protein
MFFVDIRRESAAVSLRISNDPYLAKIDPEPFPPKYSHCPVAAPHGAGSVGNRPFTIPCECAGESYPKEAETPRAAHRSGFSVRLSGL